MQLHELKPIHKRKKRKRVGRGGKRGTYSGAGMKGQKSRSGGRMKPSIRIFIKRYPKMRGYRFNPKSLKPAVVNLDTLEKEFKSGDVVTPQVLLEKRLIRKIKGKRPLVKILGKGKITKTFTIEGCLVSKVAKEQIEKANGMVK